MFAYCNNNPVIGYDPNGDFSLPLAFAGAAVNVLTTAVSAMVTGQTYTLADAGIAIASGFANALSGWGNLLAGVISGAWAGYSAYQKGATIGGALVAGAASAAATMLSISNLSGSVLHRTLTVKELLFLDSTFGMGYNLISTTVGIAATAIANREGTNDTSPSAVSGGGPAVRRLYR